MPQPNYDLIATFYDIGSVAVDDFEKLGGLHSRVQASFGFSEAPNFADPDYNADLPEDNAPYGRGIQPDPDKGGSRTIPEEIGVWTDKKGVPVRAQHQVIGVFQNGTGEVVGVRVDNNGTEKAIRARKSVVFGSGGFTQHSMRSRNCLRGRPSRRFNGTIRGKWCSLGRTRRDVAPVLLPVPFPTVRTSFDDVTDLDRYVVLRW